eukprot:SAG11_NODE_19586_length_463_cov_1.395604_1_plen_33_part_10
MHKTEQDRQLFGQRAEAAREGMQMLMAEPMVCR